MLQVNKLSKSFGDTKALTDISFTVKQGEIFGLLGANGAGKTTTLRILATMLKPSAGKVLVNDYDVTDDQQKVRGEIGLLFGGDTGLYDRLTARENIMYFAELNGMDRNEANNRIDELAELFNFTQFLDRPSGKLSKGTRQKVAFSRTIIHNPTVMLFDEPMLGLDVTSKKEVQNFITQCKDQGKTIILSDHSLELVEDVCDRIGILHMGKLLDTGSINELVSKYECKTLEEVFFRLAGENNNEQEYTGSNKKRAKRHNP